MLIYVIAGKGLHSYQWSCGISEICKFLREVDIDGIEWTELFENTDLV